METLDEPVHWLKAIAGAAQYNVETSEEGHGGTVAPQYKPVEREKEWDEGLLSLQPVLHGQSLMIERFHRLQEAVEAGNTQHNEDHQRILEECQRTRDLLRHSGEENAELRKLLDKAYPVERMKTMSASILFACALSLLTWFFLEITIIHPVLGVIGILGSAGFLGLAQWRSANAR